MGQEKRKVKMMELVSYIYMYMYTYMYVRTEYRSCKYGTVRSWCALGALEVRSWYSLGTLEFSGACGAVGAVRSAYYRLCAHARSCARLGFVHVADSCVWKEAPARHKITRTSPCVLRENVPSFDRSIDTTLLESTCEEVGQVNYGLAHPDRNVPHRIEPHLSGSVMVRSWFARGTVEVR